MARRRSIHGSLFTALLAVSLLGGCAGDGGGATATPPSTDGAGIPTDTAVAVAQLQDFWAGAMPEVYDLTYRPLPAERVVAARPGEPIPETCDGEGFAYEDVEDNAFAADCNEGQAVVWDARLMDQLARDYGAVAPAVVLAHEWGHVVQFQSGADERMSDVDAEQQADCFAGAWVATREVDGSDLDAAIVAVATFRDEPGTDAEDGEDAHGLAFDRVRAFQEGYDRGVAFCAGYEDQPPTLTQVPFSSAEEAANGGNLPLDEAIPAFTESLNTFYTEQVDGFDPIDADALDALDAETWDMVIDAHEEIGDTASATMLAYLWSGTAQQLLGEDEGRDEEGRFLQQTCMNGGWMGWVAEGGDPELELSPGDLDEAIFALARLLGAERSDEAVDAEGAFFEVVAALRQGVVQGFDSCRE